MPHVLIVDDDPSAVRLLGRVLKRIVRVTFATDGEEALRSVRQSPPDLVLLDADMPGMDGVATCQALKADPDTAGVPVIFVTAHTDPDSETRAFEIGAVDFIHKPANPPVVLARVTTHLKLKSQSDELRRLSFLDGLTGVANRRMFEEVLNREWRRAKRSREPLSLLMLDVDFFKRYNDTYGHPAGDDCLRRVAQCVVTCANRAGDLVARFGGEEFAVVLPHTRPEDAQRLAKKLCANVAALAIPHRDSLVSPNVTVSVGVASLFLPCAYGVTKASECRECVVSAGCVEGSETLVRLADQALYAAKRSGRARVASMVSTPDPGLLDGSLA